MVGGRGGEVKPTHSSGRSWSVGAAEKRLRPRTLGTRAGFRERAFKTNKASIFYPLQPEHHGAPLHLRSHLDRQVIGIVGVPHDKLAPALELPGGGLH
jgi:hypothetical protein